MCGIVCGFELNNESDRLREQVIEMAKKIRHRGPDWFGVYSDEKVIFAHERLSIVDPQSGKQPLVSKDGNLVLAVNGEIYNHEDIRNATSGSYEYLTQSDCEVIIPLYRDKGIVFLEELNGIFAFAIYDVTKNTFLIARDHIGIIPLYMGRDEYGHLYIASEMKALTGVCNSIEEFPPGHYMTDKDTVPQPWYVRDWQDYENVKDNVTDKRELEKALEEAVHRQLMSDVPYAVLLSGGLDSSIISALAKKFAAQRVETHDVETAWWPRLHSFAIGLEGSPDLAAAQKVADKIGTVHHEIHFTVQEGLDALRDVIYHVETYDVTSIRASTPMFLLARVIKSMGIKMVLSGEGADEIFGGYLYFHKAPDVRAFHEETVRKLDKLYLYDLRRANKSMSAWGVECRVPFLDKEFLDVAMRLNPKDKMITEKKIEKWLLRDTFGHLLPHEIAWRQKEQFSDGVGYNWIDSLKEMTEKAVTDEQMKNARFKFPVNTPQTKEEYYYRAIYSELFPSDAEAKCVPSVPSVACSTPEAIAWDKSFQNMIDPSGRAVSTVHKKGY